MTDKIETIGDSLIHHGKYNDRAFLFKLSQKDFPEIINKIENLVEEKDYKKVIAKVPQWGWDQFQMRGYELEARIPKYFQGQSELRIYSKFFGKGILRISEVEKKVISDTIWQSKRQNNKISVSNYFPGVKIKRIRKTNIQETSSFYKENFKTYPFPIYEEEYLKKLLEEGVLLAGAFIEDKLIAVIGAELDELFKNAELFGASYSRNKFGANILIGVYNYLQELMIEKNIRTVYSIVRALDPSLNRVFRKMGLKYFGTLENNTNINGQIESMNVWSGQI